MRKGASLQSISFNRCAKFTNACLLAISDKTAACFIKLSINNTQVGDDSGRNVSTFLANKFRQLQKLRIQNLKFDDMAISLILQKRRLIFFEAPAG
jgi:hypothetical protein